MKNAGKACNNRLYRHIRTFEKIVKNYFVISVKNTTGYKAINLFFVVFHAFTTAERESTVGLGSICLAEYLPDNRLLQTAYILLLFFLL